MSFNRAFELVIGHEGGLVDDPNDPGGLTNFGISQFAYPDEDIRNLTLVRARQLYRRDYWEPIKGDQLPPPIALCLFDFAVNSGVSRAIRTLQRVLEVPADGILGPATLGKVHARDSKALVVLLQAERLMLLADLTNFERYGRGWTRRIISTAIEACT